MAATRRPGPGPFRLPNTVHFYPHRSIGLPSTWRGGCRTEPVRDDTGPTRPRRPVDRAGYEADPEPRRTSDRRNTTVRAGCRADRDRPSNALGLGRSDTSVRPSWGEAVPRVVLGVQYSSTTTTRFVSGWVRSPFLETTGASSSRPTAATMASTPSRYGPSGPISSAIRAAFTDIVSSIA